MPAEHLGRNSKRPIHGAFKLTAATSHAQHARFAMTITTKTFTALAAATTLGLAAFATAQPAQAHHNHHHHHHQTRRRGYRTGRPRLRLLRGLRLLLEAPARLGQLGLACASRTSLRLENTNNDNRKPNGPCVCRCKGRFPLRPARHNTRIGSALPCNSPEALPKFNPRKQPLRPIPNGLFTSHSREKQEPRIDDNCCR